MIVSESTRFPYPVLSSGSRDFASGEFDLKLVVEERPATGALSIEHEVVLTERSIRQLVDSGNAIVGIFVRCDDTYYRELRRLSWPVGRTDFVPGDLINRVTIRPVVWLSTDLDRWNPLGMHPEFEPPVSLLEGDVIAIGPEFILSVGQAKLASLESIFVLDRSELVAEGSIRVDPDGERITILAAPDTFDTISLLRQQKSGLAALHNGVYLPAVMEVLAVVRSDAGSYSSRRWYRAFAAKCDAHGISIAGSTSLLEDAQRLLDHPGALLTQLLADVRGEA
jgi:hypothetical protein